MAVSHKLIGVSVQRNQKNPGGAPIPAASHNHCITIPSEVAQALAQVNVTAESRLVWLFMSEYEYIWFFVPAPKEMWNITGKCEGTSWARGKIGEESSISNSSASDCFEQMHLSYTHHLSSRVHLSVPRLDISQRPLRCTDERHILWNENQKMLQTGAHCLSMVGLFFLFSPPPKKTQQLVNLFSVTFHQYVKRPWDEAQERPLLVYVRPAC